jgi:hypothetical protein
LQINHRPFAKPKLGLEGLFLANLIDSGINAQTSVNQGSAGYFPSKDLFQFGLGATEELAENEPLEFTAASGLSSRELRLNRYYPALLQRIVLDIASALTTDNWT